MSPLNLAKKYMAIFFSETDPEELRPLFSEELLFQGPFFSFKTAEDYIMSLKADPPEGFEYKLLKSWSDDSSACLIYQFSKPGISTHMTQWFEVNNGKINKILLIFDTKAFEKQGKGKND